MQRSFRVFRQSNMAAPSDSKRIPIQDDETQSYSAGDGQDETTSSSSDDQTTGDAKGVAHLVDKEQLDGQKLEKQNADHNTTVQELKPSSSPECLRRLSRVKSVADEDPRQMKEKFDKQIIPPRVNCTEKIVSYHLRVSDLVITMQMQ